MRGAVVKTAGGVTTGRPAAAGTISLWSILKGLGTAIMALSLAGGWPSAGARAGPDPCSVDATGTIATCSGNQSAGISFVNQTVTAINVQALTTPINPVAGTPGVQLSVTGAQAGVPGGAGGSTPALTVLTAPTVSIAASANNPSTLSGLGIAVSGFAGNGAQGSTGSGSTPAGAGGTGGAAGDVTVTNNGTVVGTKTGRPVNSRAVEFNQTAQLATAQGQVTTSTTETNIRAFLRTSTVKAVTDICGTTPNPCSAAQSVNQGIRDQLINNGVTAYTSLFGGSHSFPLIGQLDSQVAVQLRGAIAIQTYLSNSPLPQEVNDRNGVVSGLSYGGNGGVGGTGSALMGDQPAARNGANGGNGGAGGAVSITNTGSIAANGNYLAGILAVSVGGTAGNGGASGFIASFGGQGGVGGSGGTIVVTNQGSITTSGTGASGIFVQSVGGAGAAAGTGFLTQNGSAGGVGGQVSVLQTGSIVTAGYGSFGIFAQSLGGTGGAGLANGANGNGGTGGSGANVNAALAGSIVTGGDYAHGIFASSVGGAGGTGGTASGAGGNGGSAGIVGIDVAAGSVIRTTGANAHAIYGMSMGGTGGTGAENLGFWAEAGGGGNGGAASNVVVANNGTLVTAGQFAYGIFAQSVGGNGGYGGAAAGLFAQSGAGGGGAPAGAVMVSNSGSITTAGRGSHAIFAQSVAGGGGDAGAAGGLIALGGDGGTAAQAICTRSLLRSQCNDGGAVTVTNSGTLTVGGDVAYGIFAQSVGGGGGNGGASAGLFAFGGRGGAGGNGGAVAVNNAGAITGIGEQSTGIFAQSIGGGGGNGGDTLSIAVGVGISIGGSGGNGGNGAGVTAINSGVLSQAGDQSTGIFAQSIGGGGGNGGDAKTQGALASAFTLAIGGSGGGGGSGGPVLVVNNGAITVAGTDATGIIAQSVGGGGGNGGDAAASGQSPVVQLSVSIGGSGGNGGGAGAVEVRNNGSITTSGERSRGVFAQSVGGGGGNGGDASAKSVSSGAPNVPVSVSLAVAVGGTAGGGGNGSMVAVSSTGVIATSGDRAHGIQAQSVGGGGGSGGSATASAQVIASPNAVSVPVSVSVGGKGGGGGSGGAVQITNSGAILTGGANAYGIFAQSVGGGGGGDGGSASTDAKADPAQKSVSVSVAIGGSGTAGGGVGGTVGMTSGGSIATAGDDATAILAQSVGGGGGAGGGANSSAAAKYTPSVSIGGSGGNGGSGGAVTVANDGTIMTLGNRAIGVFAQSVGGGGGVGGAASGKATASDNPAGASFALAVSVGGTGGGGGSGGLVNVTNTGGITTAGANAYGILAQSVGGGGGVGGGAKSSGDDSRYSLAVSVGGNGNVAGAGGNVSVSNAGSIVTTGGLAHGIYAMSVGGGGGIGGDATNSAGGGNSQGGSIALTVGGRGGAAGNGGAVSVVNGGRIDTFGFGAHGIFAQSIGGGGGSGAAGTAEASGNLSVGGGFGGGGGASGNGAAVQVSNSGTIVTRGNDAYGIFAQSVGGGGGAGIGDGGSGSAQGSGSKSIGISVGGNAGSSGNGGAVSVAHTGNITTSGDGAHGIFGQSVGGGGGVGGTFSGASTATTSFGAGVTGSGGGAGNGGGVVINSAGTIVTNGQYAYGILAQSVGGGGGLAGTNNGSSLAIQIGSSAGGSGIGGDVVVNHTGNVFALGANSHAIFAQSTGPGGNGNISVTVAGGNIVGGSGTGAGIYLDQGNANTVTIGGGASVSALSGMAIFGSGGNDVVNNSGTVTGNVQLGSGANAFNNLAGGRFVTGSLIGLGSNANTLTNSGVVDIGGQRVVATTALTGRFVQSANGTLAVDVRFGGASDLLTISGSAALAGFVMPTNLYLMPNQTAKILTANGGLTGSGLATVNSPTITYGLDYNAIGGPGGLVLTVNSVHFAAPANLSGNQRAVADQFQNIYNSGGSSALAEAMGFLVNLNATDYAAALQRLNPAPFMIQANNTFTAGLAFANSMLSCQGFDGSYAAIREHQCAWAKVTGGITTQNANSENPGYREEAARVGAGTQLQIQPDWFMGFGAGYERGHVTSGAAILDANRYDIGLTAKYVPGPWLLAAAVDGGYAEVNAYRNIGGFPQPNMTANSNSGIWHLDGKLRGAYLLETANVYAKPMADFDVIYLYLPAFSEYGAGALGLNVNNMSDVLFAGTPAVEFGATFNVADYYLRPHATLGATFFSKNSLSVGATFAGTPAGVAPFVTTSTFPQTVARLSAGLDLISSKLTGGVDIRLQYDGMFADGYQSHTGGAKVSVRF
jgi:hypothetical protein